MTTDRIRVLIVDDHAIVRTGIRHVLATTDDLDVVAEAGLIADAVTRAEEEKPDVIVLDLTIPDASGMSGLIRLRSTAPEARIIILSMHDDPEYARLAVRNGASGYLLKDDAATDLRSAVRAVVKGGSFFSPSVARAMATAAPEAKEAQPELDVLTGRERDVLAGIARGLTNKEIAGELGIGRRTVESHRENLMEKLAIRTVAGLTRFAIERGVVTE
jgi:DNA-binding NarL/FixJ family response regulator